MSLDLLREKFGYSGVTKKADNKEKINSLLDIEKLLADVQTK